MRADPRRLLACCALALAGCLGVGAVVAATPAWKQLNPAQQSLITPALKLQGGDFDKLPEVRREALLTGANRWLGMTPAQRDTATQKFQQWQQMSAAEKIAVLERRERFRKLSPEQRKSLLDTQKQFLEMPLQEQQQLQDQFNDQYKDLQRGFDGLPSQPFGTPTSPSPGATVPLGLPVTSLPAGKPGLPALPR